MKTRQPIMFDDARGGLNEVDPPTAHGQSDRSLTLAENIEFYKGGLCRKRQGSTKPAFDFTAITGDDVVCRIWKHEPTGTGLATKLVMSNKGGQMGYAAMGGIALTNLAVTDAWVTGAAQHQRAVSFNGKLFICGDNGVDRMHLFDGTALRRVGQERTSAAPTTGTSAGAVTDTRKYAVAYTKKTGSTIDLRSELSTATAAVALSSQRCTVTKNSNPGDSETHWELWASNDDTSYTVWYKIADATIGTSTIEDNNVNLQDATGFIFPDAGTYSVPISAKYIVADDNRIVFGGSWEQDAYASRVWWSPVLGTEDIGDDERFFNTTTLKGYMDVMPGNGGGLTALGGPLFDSVFAFKAGQVHKLTKTGVATGPYRLVTLSKTVGCIEQDSVVIGEDEGGSPSLYFMSRRGPYRVSMGGVQYVGADIEDTWSTVNLSASGKICHGVYDHRKHQVIWWVATGSSNTPNKRIVFDTRYGYVDDHGEVRGGWSIDNGSVTDAYFSIMYGNDLLTSAGDLDEKPMACSATVNETIFQCDTDSKYTDWDGTGYKSQFKSRYMTPTALDRKMRVVGAFAVAKPNSSSSPCLWLRAIKDWETGWAEYHISVPAFTGPRVLISQHEAMSDSAGPAEALAIAYYVYDSADQQVGWQLDAVGFELEYEEQR